MGVVVPSGVVPRPRAYHRTLSLAGELYISGGWSGTEQLDEILKYDPATGVCTALRQNSGYGRHSHNVMANAAGTAIYQLYGAGGTLRNTYDKLTRPGSNFTTNSLSASGRAQRQEASSGFIGGYGYLFGGWDLNNNMLNETLRWTPETTTMALMNPANPPVARRGATYEVMNEQLYVLGGATDSDASNRLKDFWCYNPAANTWTRLADFPETIRHSTMCAVNGKLYVHGGVGDSADAGAKMRVYNPATDTWSVLDIGKTTAYAGMAGSAVGDSIYYFGGVDTKDVISNRLFRFTPPA